MFSRARAFLAKHPQAEWIIPAAFCFILLSQLLFSMHRMSQHADESTHLYAGYRVLRCGDYAFGREHPPLAKMLSAIPLAFGDAPMDCSASTVVGEEAAEAIEWLYSQTNWWQLLLRARVASSLFALTLCLGIWITARQMFGRAAAVASTAVLVFEPNVMGHGALVLNDILLSSLFVLTVFWFYVWTRQRSAPPLVGTGFCLGLALLTKHSAVLLVPILILLAICASLREKGSQKAVGAARRNAGAVAVMLLIAMATIWCGYGLRYSEGKRRASDSAVEEQAKVSPASVRVLKTARAAHLLPQAYLDGLIEMRSLVNKTDKGAYILGRYYPEAPWYFFPLTTTIKFTLPFLAMLVLGGWGLAVFGRERRTEILFLALPALVYLAASMHVRRISGVWHLFPLLPFLIVMAASGCVYLARRYRWAVGALVCLLVLHAVSSLRSYPNYLSYANEAWGGSGDLYQHLPWTDVGQAYWEVSRYMEQHPNTPCWVDSNFYMPVNPFYKIPCTQMGFLRMDAIPERMTGIVFVSSSALALEGQPGGELAPFYTSKAKVRLGGSAVLVYEGDFDTRVLAARALTLGALTHLIDGQRQEAMSSAEQSVALAPNNAVGRQLLCLTLVANRRPQEGLLQCSIARNLALANPRSSELADEITRQMRGIATQSSLPLPPGVE